ncbi:two-partner secretion domain-containing protein, partial [Fusobacterium necrophorum]
MEEDVTLNQQSSVDIKPKNTSSITVTKDETTGGTVVDINKPNDNGISHNEYDTFNMNGEGSRVLFNNSGIDQSTSASESPLGFKNVKKNHNFDSGDKATLIITEITGGSSTTLEGKLEVRNDSNNGHEPYNVDLIFANENGIHVNGITYYNVDNVMYVNDSDWAKRNELEKRKKELDEEEKKESSKDNVKLFGNRNGSEGIIHKGKQKKNSFEGNEKTGWRIPDGGISKNKEKQRRLEEEERRAEEEKRRLEEERERLERERQERERQEKEKLEREQKEKEKLEREQKEKEKLEREQKEKEKLEREQKEKEKLEREQKEKEKLEREQKEKEKLEREQKEKEKLEREQKEKEKLEREQKE